MISRIDLYLYPTNFIFMFNNALFRMKNCEYVPVKYGYVQTILSDLGNVLGLISCILISCDVGAAFALICS